MEGNKSLPREAQFCPNCRYDLHGTLRSGSMQCPECGYVAAMWQLRELHAPDLDGEPRSLRPRERRMKGCWFVPLLAIITVALLMLAVIVLRSLDG